jgi:hypothetical protein
MGSWAVLAIRSAEGSLAFSDIARRFGIVVGTMALLGIYTLKGRTRRSGGSELTV